MNTKFEKVKAGWYRKQHNDGGLWIHIIKRHGEWCLIANNDKYTAPIWALRYSGYTTLGEAKIVSKHMFGV